MSEREMKMGCWHYYLPSQDPEGECQHFFTCSYTDIDSFLAAKRAFRHYWENHDGYELGVDEDYELVLISPKGRESRWLVRAEQSIAFRVSSTGEKEGEE